MIPNLPRGMRRGRISCPGLARSAVALALVGRGGEGHYAEGEAVRMRTMHCRAQVDDRLGELGNG